VLLDTGILFDYFADGSNASRTERLLSESRGTLSAITVFELFRGVVNQKHIRQREQLVRLCEVINIDRSVAIKASDYYTALKKKGLLVCNEDILIAACAFSRGCLLFTQNKSHFKNMSGLILF
jgi:predicted nucleic acid-binding protein